MRNDIINSLDFKQVRTIIAKEQSDLEEWRKCITIPFLLLDKNDTYVATYVVFKEHRNYGYSITGIPEKLCRRLLEKIDDANQVFLTIRGKNEIKEHWLINRD